MLHINKFHLFLIAFLAVEMPASGLGRLASNPEAWESMPFRWFVSALALITFISYFWKKLKPSSSVLFTLLVYLKSIYSIVIIAFMNHFQTQYTVTSLLVYCIVPIVVFQYKNLIPYFIFVAFPLFLGLCFADHLVLPKAMMLMLWLGLSLCIISILWQQHNAQSKLHKLNGILIHEKELAEQAVLSKSLFLSQMSHEIRTPMNAIIGLSSIAKKNVEEGSELYQEISTIHESATQLLNVLNDILDYSKIEAGKMQVEKIPMNPIVEVERIFRGMKLIAQEKGLQFSLEIAENVPSSVYGDPTRLSQILNNFCSNALKFTHHGSIVLKINLLSWENNEVLIKFSVKDSGIGLSEDQMVHIFERFNQADATIARKYGGTGLGLSISKLLAELQGGELLIQSELNVGSEFGVILPYQICSEMIADTSVVQGDLSPFKILVVDDNPVNLMVARKILERLKAQVLTCQDPFDVEKQILIFEPDLILLDLHMPGRDGFQVFEDLKTMWQKKGPALKVFALTADAFDETRELILAQGMETLISKPFREQDLLKAILTKM